MSQIFISYASEDRSWVEPFARTLEKQGWSVWWDRHIPTGHTYDDVIWSALQVAKCVVVVWSTHSIGSEWVKEEASEAKKRNILLPVRIDEARPPFGFSRRQTQSLVGWQEGVPHRGYDQLLMDIAQVLQTAPPVLSTRGSALRARMCGYLWLILPTVLVLVSALSLMAWRVPARVEIDVTVDRVEFTVGQREGGWTHLLGPVDFLAVTIGNFDQLELSPKSVEVADPGLYDFERDAYPTSAWRPAVLTQDPLRIRAGAAARHPSVTIRSVSPAVGNGLQPAGRLDSVSVVAGSLVSIERAGGAGTSLTIDLRAEGPKASLTPASSFHVVTRHATIEGATVPSFAQQEGLTYRVSLKAGRPTVGVEGNARSLTLTLRPTTGAGDRLRGGDVVAVTALDFFKQGRTGGRTTALTEGAESVIRYPDFPDLPGARVAAPDDLAIEQLERFVIKNMEWPATGGGIRLTLDGVAGRLLTKSGEFTKDHRLTQFDKLRHNPRLLALLAILGWAIPTVVGARKLFKELR